MPDYPVHFFGVLRGVVDAPRISVSLPPEFGLTELVAALAARCGAQLPGRLCTRSGHLHSHVRLFVADTEAQGLPDERFGPFPAEGGPIEIFVVPMCEGG